MIGGLLAGAALGGAICLLAWTLIPARTDQVAVLGRLDAARTAHPQHTPPPTSEAADRLGQLRQRAGRRLARGLARRGVTATTLRQDLAIAGSTLEDHLGGSLLSFVTAAVGTLIGGLLLIEAGVPIPPGLLPLAALLVASAIVLARLHDAHRLAGTRRREFRRALSAYLDLVAMSMMAGTGLPEALPTAAHIGKGWPFRLLTDTLDRARDMAGPLAAPHELGQLGQRIGISELRDLSAALTLTGEQGARLPATLIARAQTLRDRDTADVQGQAAERDSSMQVAQVAIAGGFLLFIVYPLVFSVLHY